MKDDDLSSLKLSQTNQKKERLKSFKKVKNKYLSAGK